MEPFELIVRPVRLSEFQKRIEAIYLERDRKRGIPGTFVWFVEEVGELARAVARQDDKARREELADCLAWLSTLASLHGIDLEEAVSKYADGCPRCRMTPCGCSHK